MRGEDSPLHKVWLHDPYIEVFNERIEVDGEYIEDDQLSELAVDRKSVV